MEQMENTYLTKHRQIIETLTAEIEQGRLKPYDRLPSEKELCERCHASRSTVRKAMDQLTDRGKIFRVPGKGSFVSFPKISHDTSQILSFSEKMKAQGLDVVTKLIQKEMIEPNEEITATLKLAPPARVLKIQRLRIVKGEPLALQTAFLPSNLCETLMKEDLESKSLNYLLREQCGIRLSRSDVWIEAPIISSKERHLLGNPPAPLFLAVVGLTFDQHDKPVRFSRGVFRGDRVRLKISDSSVFELDYSSLLG
ncbi:MAG: GntR family transcriptional regulator [Deltaproteobacteria bacterium]|nr:GntR family transcriptional regulator [Deltaproteobacteria bacterium]